MRRMRCMRCEEWWIVVGVGLFLLWVNAALNNWF